MDAPRPRQSRSVSFKPLSTLCLYYEAPEPEDGFNVWYTEDEEEAFKASARLEASVLQLVQREEPLELGIFHNPEDLFTVGLEKYLLSPESKLKRVRLKRLVKYSVLMAQALGSPVDGDSKAERVAHIATRLSKWFVDQAKAIGKLHEKESSL